MNKTDREQKVNLPMEKWMKNCTGKLRPLLEGSEKVRGKEGRSEPGRILEMMRTVAESESAVTSGDGCECKLTKRCWDAK